MSDPIIEKLTSFERRFDKLDSKIDGIEETIKIIAVQTERIDNNSRDISTLWAKHDDEFGPNGVVTRIKEWQLTCPREQIRVELRRQWSIIEIGRASCRERV